MAIEPTAVTPQESREIAPTCAMFVGSMMMPEPIMFTATMNVSCIRDIFLAAVATISSALFGHAVDVIGPVVLLSPFDFLGKAWELLTPLLHRAQVGEPRTICWADVLARHHDGNARRVGDDADAHDAVRDLVERHLLRLAGHQELKRAARRHLRCGERGIGLGLPVSLPPFLHIR